jgi:hypothetical protein
MILLVSWEKRMKRPLSLSIIGWLVLVITPISLIRVACSMSDPELWVVIKTVYETSLLPFGLLVTWAYLILVVQFICAVGILYGKNWSRWTYATATLIGIAFALLTRFSLRVLPDIVEQAIILFFLFRPAANRWFEKGKTVSPDA